MPTIDISADADSAYTELSKFEDKLNSVADRFKNLNSVTIAFNKNGEELGATVRSQTAQFEKLTQILDKAGDVTKSYYSKDEAGARAAAARRQAVVDASYEADKVARDRAYDAAERKRLAAIDKEIRDLERAAVKKAEIAERERLKAEKEAAKPPPTSPPSLIERNVDRVARTVVSTSIARGTSFVEKELLGSVAAAKDLQIQLSLIRTLQQGSDQQSLGKTGRDVRSVSDETGFDIKDVGKAFYDATSNQITKGAQTKEFVKQAAEFARVTGSDLPSSVNLLSTAINSYNLSAADAEKISAIFFKTIDEGRVVASEMANTLGRLYPLASQVGVSMTEVNAAIAITTQKGVKTNDAITLMSNLLIKLEKPTEQTAEFFKSLGVTSGEAAVQLYGFTGLIRKMVEAVNSGQVPVSAFFDEIRGRKQFAVFQQSIDEIEKFNAKLKDTSKIVTEYRAAQSIRGESSGDQLAKEANKLSNVFKVELGQAILENLAILNKWVGGVEGVREAVGGFKNVLIAGAITAVGYTIVVKAAVVTNAQLAASFKALGASIDSSFKAFAFLTVAIGTYVATKDRVFGGGTGGKFDVDPNVIDALTGAVERFNAANKAASSTTKYIDPFESLNKQKESIDATFKEIGGLVAAANIVNNKALDEAKAKAKDVADAVKVSFAGFTDTTKKGISDLKKGITDAQEEIKRSKKSLESFGDRGQEALFNFRSKYANDDFGEQKINLTAKKVSDLQKRADAEYAKGTQESIAEGRKLYDVLLAEEVKLEELKVEHRKKQFEADIINNPEAHNIPGGHTFTVDDSAITGRIAQITAQQAVNEERVLAAKKSQIEQNQKLIITEEARLRTLEAALKKYEGIDIYNKSGDVKDEFKTQGKFDPKKLQDAQQKSEDEIRAAAGGNTNERFQLEVLFFQRRTALSKEAILAEKAEYLKASEARFSAEKDNYQKNVDDIKKRRQEDQSKEGAQFSAVAGGEQVLAAFITQIKGAGLGFHEAKNEYKELDDAFKQYQDALVKLKNTRKTENGVEYFDPKAIDDAKSAFDSAVKRIAAVNAGINRAGSLDANGKSATDARAGIGQQFDELKKTSGNIYADAVDEAKSKEAFDKQVAGPILALKAQFPLLATEGGKALNDLNANFKTLATGGVQQLKEQLEAIQKLIPKAGPPVPPGTGKGQIGFLDDESGVAYAATGGVVGMFPGQPKGVDRYPIWAAKGERIISAETSAQYAPLLDAIMQRRAPRYMAEGGVVGSGTTTIGDINVTVNGATTNTETARVIGNRLERQLRQNNIRLDPRK